MIKNENFGTIGILVLLIVIDIYVILINANIISVIFSTIGLIGLSICLIWIILGKK